MGVDREERIALALRHLADAVSSRTQTAFFETFVLSLVDALGVHCAFVAGFSESSPDRVEVIACCRNGEIASNCSYFLAGTPCEDVIRDKTFLFLSDVHTDYPQASLLRQMGVTSYLGAPLFSSSGDVIGIVTAVGIDPLVDEEYVRDLVRVFGMRAAAELERQRNEDALRTSEERYALAVAGSSQGIWDWDLETNQVFYSPRIGEMLEPVSTDLPREKLPFLEFTHSEDVDRLKARVERHIRKTAPYDIEFRMLHRDGTYHWFHARGQAQWNRFDVPIRMAGSIVDISDRKQDEAERDALITKLEQTNTELERFTYTVSHDLKSPLVTIKGFLGLIREDLETADIPQAVKDLGQIEHAADRMNQLLDELLNLSRIGRIANPIEKFGLSEVIADVIQTMGGLIRETRAVIDVPDDLPRISGDRVRISEVFQNLIENAIKFRGDRPPRISVQAEVVDTFVQCEVADDGIGIEPKFHDSIFGLFEQLERRGEGTGIGLALVKRIVDTHGGQIAVESAGLGQGTRFRFLLPTESIDATIAEALRPS